MVKITDRLIRYADLIPCRNAFIDTRSPGSETKENFTLIGPGVSENPDQHIHIAEPHGFNIGAARQPGRCLNSQHSHETAEVFIVHTGKWRFVLGQNADEASIELRPGDVISLPPRMFRGFENVGSRASNDFLFAVLGGDDPGKVVWAPSVFAMAKKYGLVLLDGGRLIDTVKGETIPPNAKLQKPPTDAVIRKLATPTAEQMAGCVVHYRDLVGNPASALAGPGIADCPIIVPKASSDGFLPGPIVGWWPHGFNMRCLKMQSGASVAAHVRTEPEVIFVHAGALEVSTPEGSVLLAAGDTFTTPKDVARAFRATSSDRCVAYVTRGGDAGGKVRFT